MNKSRSISLAFTFLLALNKSLGTLSQDDVAIRPYMGWSSWSLQATTMPGRGLNWLKEENILPQIDAMAELLLEYGYNYINIDSGWNADYNWEAGFDSYGRPSPNPERFPRGIKFVADYAHSKGLKLGIYAVVGLPMGVFGPDQSNKVDFPVLGPSNCTGFDLVYPDFRTTNGWDSSYKMDFTNPCSQEFINSIASQFASWGIDFLKLDGVGPGSWKNGSNYDNRPDVAAWRSAIDATGRDIIFELSWSLDPWAIDTWTQYADGWRIDTDVECYCDTLVRWDASVVQRFTELPPWIDFAKPGRWNDLDSLNVGNGTMDGLTDHERQSYATLWAISCAPLYIGDDLRQLDAYGLSLLTNREVLDINQNGTPAKPIVPYGDQQVWVTKSPDNASYIVGVFNLASSEESVDVLWKDFGLNDGSSARVRDIWSGEDMEVHLDHISLNIPTHGSRLLRVTPVEL